MDKMMDDVVKVYITDGSYREITLDDLAPRFPPHTTMILSNSWGEENPWCLEVTPNVEYYEGGNPVWPWPTGIAEYGPTSQAVIDQVDELLRKVKR